MLVDRGKGPRDVVCGGFLGWDALAHLDLLGIDHAALGARRITRLRLVAGARTVEADLPYAAAGLSRRALDTALLAAAGDAGAQVRSGQLIREIRDQSLRLDDGAELEGDALFLATGKHEVRGAARPVAERALSVGLRAALPPDAVRDRALDSVIELHLLGDGYAGLLLQEDGTTNLCLSIETARLAEAGGKAGLLAALTTEAPLLAERIGAFDGPWDAVAGVPYGWRASAGSDGVWRVGDQAAVIASLAGDGVAIALASGSGAARAFAMGEDAATWQRRFAARASRPITTAEMLRRAAQDRRGQRLLMGLAHRVPGLARLAARLTRIG